MNQKKYLTNKNIIYRLESNYNKGKLFIFDLNDKKFHILPKIANKILIYAEEPKTFEDISKLLTNYVIDNRFPEDYLKKLKLFLKELIQKKFLVEC